MSKTKLNAANYMPQKFGSIREMLDLYRKV